MLMRYGLMLALSVAVLVLVWNEPWRWWLALTAVCCFTGLLAREGWRSL